MGLPFIDITFKELGISSIRRGQKGIVALVIYDDKNTESLDTVYEMYDANDYPETFSEYNKKQIQKAWLGYVTTPRKVIVVVEQGGEAVKKGDVTQNAFALLESMTWDILAVPGIQLEETEALAAWIKSMNDNYHKGVVAVMPHTPNDNENIINYTMPEVKDMAGNVYKTEDYLSRIAGLVAGTPMTISCTYAPLMELVSCTNFKKDELDDKIDNGQFVLFNDGAKIKVARGVNSLNSITEDKRDSFKKIKLVQLMHLIRTDIKRAAEDNYLGKYSNSYDNKILLCSAITGYLKELERAGLAEKDQSQCLIDVEAQKNYLISTGYKTKDGRGPEDWEEIDILYGDTDDKVFLNARTKLLDAIEEIHLPIEI